MTPVTATEGRTPGERFSETRDIPAQSGGRVEVEQGSMIRIIDVEGTQVVDMFAVW